jgi:hypothetical protein
MFHFSRLHARVFCVVAVETAGVAGYHNGYSLQSFVNAFPELTNLDKVAAFNNVYYDIQIPTGFD